MTMQPLPPIRELVESFLKHWKAHAPLLKHNQELLEIYDGALLPKVKAALKTSFTRKDGTVSESYNQIEDRIVPVNILRRIVDKKSRIYQKSPVREVMDGSDNDKELLSFYEKAFKWNRQMNIANEYFNLFEYTAIEPVAAGGGRMVLRPLANDTFLPYSVDTIDPTRPTHFIVYHGKRQTGAGSEDVFRAYSDAEFVLFNEKGDLLLAEMDSMGLDGRNPYGKLPYIYVNRDDQRRLIPEPNTDTLKMTILIPLLLSDLSFALKFQAFSIMYAINIRDSDFQMSPNALWMINSDPETDKPAQIGSIKPQVDSDKALSVIQAVLSIWLQSIGIRPGAVGQLTTDNFASGVAKMIDEMDTSDDRQKQTEFFGPAEEDAWDLVLKRQHPVWKAQKRVENNIDFGAESTVAVSFPEQLPVVKRKEVLDELVVEMEKGLESRKGAIRRLNPHMTDEEVEAKIQEIDEEKKARAEAFGVPPQPGDGEKESGEGDENEGGQTGGGTPPNFEPKRSA